VVVTLVRYAQPSTDYMSVFGLPLDSDTLNWPTSML
jgi:hypothetical protein